MLDHMYNNLSWKLQSVSRNYQYFKACLSNNHGFIILKGKCAHLSAYRPYNVFSLADPKGGEGFQGFEPPLFWPLNAFKWGHIVGPPLPLFRSGLDPPFLEWLDPPLILRNLY